jgi:hypothetical protein
MERSSLGEIWSLAQEDVDSSIIGRKLQHKVEGKQSAIFAISTKKDFSFLRREPIF